VEPDSAERDTLTDAQHPLAPPPGWYDDPSGQGGLRYWNGTEWTSRAPAASPQAALHPTPEQAPAPSAQPYAASSAETKEQTATAWLAGYWQNRAPWSQIIANLFSLRLFYVCAASSLTIGAVLAVLIWEPLAYLAIPLFFVLWLGLSISPTTVAYCPYCSKRVKLGASACHHCGRAV